MPQRLLNDGQQYVEAESVGLESRVAALEDRLVEVEHAVGQVKREAVVALLNLLGQAIRQIVAGKIDLDTAPSVTAGGNSKWEVIKKRLPTRQAEAIDILLAQGSLKRTQLAAAMKMNYTNCATNVIAVLMRQGLLVESGGLISLKDL